MRRKRWGLAIIACTAACRLGGSAMPHPAVEIVRTSDRAPSELDPLLHVTLPPLEAGALGADAEAMVQGDVHATTTERFQAAPVLDGGARDGGVRDGVPREGGARPTATDAAGRPEHQGHGAR